MKRAEKKEIAFDLYMNTNYTQSYICEIVGCTEKTFSDWKAKHKWGELKAANQTTPEQIVGNLYRKILTLSEDTTGYDNSEEIAKLASAIEKIKRKELSVSGYINAMEHFTKFLANKDPHAVKLIASHVKNFIQMIANESIR